MPRDTNPPDSTRTGAGIHPAYWLGALFACVALAALAVIASVLVPMGLRQAASPTATTAWQHQVSELPIQPATPRPTAAVTNGPPAATTPTRVAPTPVPLNYHIEAVTPQGDIGIASLYVFATDRPVEQVPVERGDLRLPTENLVPSVGRFHDIRGYSLELLHLGSDYLNPAQDLLAPPTDDSVLVVATHIRRESFLAIALDMSGDVQMHLVTVRGPEQFLICFVHLQASSNDRAVEQARLANGHVETIGTVAVIDVEKALLSDLHIAVIDVARLLDLSGETDLRAALLTLFSGSIPRTDKQYAEIFVRPEDVLTALEDILEAYPTE